MKGTLCAIGIFMLAMNLSVRANLLTNPDFETVESVGGVLTTFEDWGWDYGTIVTSENGITPQEGNRMLRFDTTTTNGTRTGDGSSILQIIDMAPYATEISNGTAVITGSAYFNRVAGNANTDNLFGIQFVAYSGTPSEQPTTLTELGSSSSNTSGNDLFSDADPSTWELVTHSWLLPTGTTYVKFTLNAFENVFNNSTGPEFDGHYADSAVANVIPEPGVVSLLILGVMGIYRFVRQR